MYTADYHSHSSCSIDGHVSMTELARAAVGAGLDELCVTDHCDLLDIHGKPGTNFTWAPLIEQFNEARAQYGDRVKLRLGLELGEAQSSEDLARAILSDCSELDFVIGSTHSILDVGDLFLIKYPNEAVCYDYLEIYFAELERLASLDCFDVIGHVTYPLRYMNAGTGFNISFDRYEDRLAGLFRTLVSHGKGIELNTSGYRYNNGIPMPPPELIRLYRDCGGEIITVGSDAHYAKHVGAGLHEGYEVLRAAGFKYVTVFEKRVPGFVEL